MISQWRSSGAGVVDSTPLGTGYNISESSDFMDINITSDAIIFPKNFTGNVHILINWNGTLTLVFKHLPVC